MSTRPLLYKYPLDLSGSATTNLVNAEPHTLDSVNKRIFVPNCGPFYVDSMVVVDVATGLPLEKITEFLVLQPYQEASVKSGLDVASIVYVTKTGVTDVLITYQVVGGEFSWATYALNEMIQTLDLDNRPVFWGDIIGTLNAYPPTPHLHDLGDTYGWEYVVAALENIRRAILIGDETSHDSLKQYVDTIIQTALVDSGNADAAMSMHISNTSNPHGTTKAQVGLSNVQNYSMATEIEGVEGTVANRYMSPSVTKAAIVAAINALTSTMNTALSGKLGTTAQAADSAKLDGKTLAEVEQTILNNVVTSIGGGTGGTGGGGYTDAEIDQLLLGKLDANASVANANKVYGYTQEELTAYLQQNMNVLNMPGYGEVVEVGVDTVLEPGRTYFIKASVVLTLPSITNAAANLNVNLIKAIGANPTITVNPVNATTNIRVSGAEDTSVLYDVKRPISVVYDFSEAIWLI